MRKKTGFTLIELLVVIAIIALLLSIMTPSLMQVKDRAMRIRCSNRLHQWGIAIHAYSADNDAKMMTTMIWDLESDPWPAIAWMWANPEFFANNEEYADQWATFRINPYIDAFSKHFLDDGLCTPMVTCPAASGEFMQKYIHRLWEEEGPVKPAAKYF
jgi:prepilin-type N-terminal cleavage/methylation domain-containing protein